MDLLDFARNLPADFTEAQFVDELREVVDLDQIRYLSDDECQNMYDAVAYLADYLLLVREFYQQTKTMNGCPYVVYRAPVIWNQLTRGADEKPDYTQLTTFGLGSGDG